jgi:hypothetical protein
MATENLIGQLGHVFKKRENLVAQILEARKENLRLSLDQVSPPAIWGELVIARCFEMGGKKAAEDMAFNLGRDGSSVNDYALELKGGSAQYFLHLGVRKEAGAAGISLLAPVESNQLSTSIINVNSLRVREAVEERDILADRLTYQHVINGLAELIKEAPTAHAKLQELLEGERGQEELLAKELAELQGLIEDRKFIRGEPRNPDPQE